MQSCKFKLVQLIYNVSPLFTASSVIILTEHWKGLFFPFCISMLPSLSLPVAEKTIAQC